MTFKEYIKYNAPVNETEFLISDTHKLKDLYGIEKYTKLEKLNIHHTYIFDISPLSELKKLKRLDLYSNKIVDIKAISTVFSIENPYCDMTKMLY